MSRLDEMRGQVNAFHEKHPLVWTLFVRFTKDRIGRGFKNYSVNAIFERIRWEADVDSEFPAAFKLNNNYRAFYARRFMKMYSEFDGFFRTREQTSGDKEATEMRELSPEDFE